MSHHLALFRFWVTEVTSPYGLIPRNLDMGKSQTGKSNGRTGLSRLVDFSWRNGDTPAARLFALG